MNKTVKRQHSAAFKSRVAFEALRGEKTLAEISSQFGVHTTQINRWKKELVEGMQEIFTDKRKKRDLDQEGLIEQLYKQVGKKEIEIDWLKKWLLHFKNSSNDLTILKAGIT